MCLSSAQEASAIYQEILRSPVLYQLLLKADVDLAVAARAGRCPRCAGPLHVADYPRKPRGDVGELPAGYDTRFSLCCGECRKRATPPSLRFLGRRVYLGTVVVLVSAMLHGVTGRRAAELRRVVGVPARTVARWRTWWQEAFIQTPTWAALRGRLMPPPQESALPFSLTSRVCVPLVVERVEVLMRLLRALTTGSCPVVL